MELKKSFSKIQQTQPLPPSTGGAPIIPVIKKAFIPKDGVVLTSSKPTGPSKGGGKQTVTVGDITWKLCQTCFGGKGTWNRTHCTARQSVGARSGYKGIKKTGPVPNAAATANVVAQNYDNENAVSGGVF